MDGSDRGGLTPQALPVLSSHAEAVVGGWLQVMDDVVGVVEVAGHLTPVVGGGLLHLQHVGQGVLLMGEGGHIHPPPLQAHRVRLQLRDLRPAHRDAAEACVCKHNGLFI